MLVSHHGKMEYGSPKECMFSEAIALYYADELSSKLSEMIEYISDSKERKAELLKQGVSARELTRGILSLRVRRFFKKAAGIGLTALSLPFFIPYLGVKTVARAYYDNILMTPGAKKGARMIIEDWKAFAETPQQIIATLFS